MGTFFIFVIFSKRARNVSNISAFIFFQKGSTTGISQMNLRSKFKKVNGDCPKSKLPEEFVTSPIIVAQVLGSGHFPKKNIFSKKIQNFTFSPITQKVMDRFSKTMVLRDPHHVTING